MILAAVLTCAIAAVAVSELLGRGRVVYTRMAGLVVSYVLACGGAGVVVVARGGSTWDVAAIVLSTVPLMAAWLGFRIHLTNSITLEMAELLSDGQARTLDRLAALYDVDGHTARRVAILQDAGYLDRHGDGGVLDTPKSRAVLRLVAVVCGPDGPRFVADALRARERARGR